jgi:hypothetical protein
MVTLSRGVLAAIIGVVCLNLTSATAAAAPVGEPPGSPSGFGREILWDPALDNEFGWSMAGDRIPTACNDVRAAFPTSVAMMGCEVYRPNAPQRPPSKVAAFFGGGGGGGGGPATSTGGSDTPAGDATLVTTPLPGGLALLLSGLGGLAIARRSGSRRLVD